MRRFEISSRKPSPFKVAVNRAVRRTDTLSRSKRDQPKAARYQQGKAPLHTGRESREGGFASKVKKVSNEFNFALYLRGEISPCCCFFWRLDSRVHLNNVECRGPYDPIFPPPLAENFSSKFARSGFTVSLL
jgi:hypothetical protein